MKKLLILILLLSILLPLSVFAQNNKLKRLLKAARYQEAVELYQKIIQTDSSASVRTGMANCYFQLRKYQEANKLYDAMWKEESLNPNHLKKAAQTKWLLGDRQTAKDMLKIYLTEREDEEAYIMMENLNKAENFKSIFPDAQIKNFVFNSDGDDNTPFFDGKYLYFTSDRQVGGINPLRKKNSITGRSFFKIYKSEVSETEAKKPVLIGSEVNALNTNTGGVTIHKNRAIFSRNTTQADRSGTFSMQLYEIDLDAPFAHKKTNALSFCKLSSNYMHPAFSPDGKMLIFASDKAGSAGGLDIFFSTWSRGKWSYPKPLDVVNTPLNEGFPFMDVQNNLYFASNGLPGFGGYDIFVTHFDGENWEEPVNVGAPINTIKDDFGFVKVGNRAFFSSDRATTHDDLYQVEIPAYEDPLEDYNQLRGEMYQKPSYDRKVKSESSRIAFRYFKPKKAANQSTK